MFLSSFIALQCPTFLAKYQHNAMHDRMKIYAHKNITEFLIVIHKTYMHHDFF